MTLLDGILSSQNSTLNGRDIIYGLSLKTISYLRLTQKPFHQICLGQLAFADFFIVCHVKALSCRCRDHVTAKAGRLAQELGQLAKSLK